MPRQYKNEAMFEALNAMLGPDGISATGFVSNYLSDLKNALFKNYNATSRPTNSGEITHQKTMLDGQGMDAAVATLNRKSDLLIARRTIVGNSVAPKRADQSQRELIEEDLY